MITTQKHEQQIWLIFMFYELNELLIWWGQKFPSEDNSSAYFQLEQKFYICIFQYLHHVCVQ